MLKLWFILYGLHSNLLVQNVVKQLKSSWTAFVCILVEL